MHAALFRTLSKVVYHYCVAHGNTAGGPGAASSVHLYHLCLRKLHSQRHRAPSLGILLWFFHQDIYIGRRQYLTLLITSFVFLTKVSINASYLGKKKYMDVCAIISGPERGRHICSKKKEKWVLYSKEFRTHTWRSGCVPSHSSPKDVKEGVPFARLCTS